jgi:hypothetical protein
VFGPKTSTSLQIILAADAHVDERKFLLTEETLNRRKSRIYITGTRRPTISKAEGHDKLEYF